MDSPPKKQQTLLKMVFPTTKNVYQKRASRKRISRNYFSQRFSKHVAIFCFSILETSWRHGFGMPKPHIYVWPWPHICLANGFGLVRPRAQTHGWPWGVGQQMSYDNGPAGHGLAARAGQLFWAGETAPMASHGWPSGLGQQSEFFGQLFSRMPCNEHWFCGSISNWQLCVASKKTCQTLQVVFHQLLPVM